MKMKQLLVIRLDEIGDFVLTVPLLRELKTNFPDTKINLVVKKNIAQYAQQIKYVSKVYGAAVKRKDILKNFLLFVKLFWYRCRHGKYDAVILPRFATDRSCSRLLAYAAGSKKILAYKNSLHGIDAWIPTDLLDDECIHSVLSNLKFVEYLGGKILNNSLSTGDICTNKNKLVELKKYIDHSESKKYAICCPCSFTLNKNWDIENYCKVITYLYENFSVKTILFGSDEDIVHVDNILKNTPDGAAVSLCGKTRISDLPLAVTLGNFYFGADTSVVHFAAAAKIPCVILTPHAKGYDGIMSAEYRFHPYQTKYRIINPKLQEPPCQKECSILSEPHCIENIHANSVISEIEELLNL